MTEAYVSLVIVQCLIGLIMMAFNIYDWYDTKKNYQGHDQKDEYFAQATKWTRIGGITTLTSPIGPFLVPIAVVAALIWAIKVGVSKSIPVFTYKGNS